MTSLSFETLETNDTYEFPKGRGRPKAPLNEGLVKALHDSLTHGNTVKLKLEVTQKNHFSNYLSRAGKELNYVIRRNFEEDKNGKTGTMYFRVMGLREEKAAE